MTLNCPECGSDEELHITIPLKARIDGGEMEVFEADTEISIECDECVTWSKVYAEELDEFSADVTLEGVSGL